MRRWMVLGMLVWVAPALGQEDLTVLKPRADGVPPAKQLYSYLQGEAQKHFDSRRQAIAALKTPADVQRRQQELHARFLAALGELPEKTPLNPKVTGREQRDGYRIEKVVYESRPNHHVTAILYLPDGKPPYPGVLVPCGHSSNGKAAEPYQRACILLAKNGLAVLCYDPIGQGERFQLLDAQGKPAIPGGTSEHTMVGIGSLLVGRSTAGYRVWDGIRSIDYLASRPEVDPKRIGCTGNSGGGTLTAYLMALDDRIAVAAPSCYITSLERLLATIGPQDAEQNITGQVAFGMEHSDYVTMRAPKPTLLCVGSQDFFDIQGAWTTFREAKLLYGLLGHGERVDLFEFNDKHGFSKPRREAAMRWMRRWLLAKDDAPVENEFAIAKDPEIQCTRTGQVLEDYKGKSVFSLNAERDRQLAEQRAKVQASRGKTEFLIEVQQRIHLGAVQPAKRQVVGSPLQRDGMRIEKCLYTTEPGVVLPALEFVASKAGPSPQVVLYVHGGGKAVDAAPGGPIEKLAQSGARVIAVDLRGFGELAAAKPAPNRPSFFGSDSREAFLGLLLNRPLLGQRVQDMHAVIRSLVAGGGNPVEIIGVGAAGPIALHAAALSPDVGRLTLDGSLISWSAVVQMPVTYNQLTNVVPNVLQVYDLPDLAAYIAPRPLTIRAAVDPVNKPVSQAELDKVYAGCRAAYEQKQASKHLILQAKP